MVDTAGTLCKAAEILKVPTLTTLTTLTILTLKLILTDSPVYYPHLSGVWRAPRLRLRVSRRVLRPCPQVGDPLCPCLFYIQA